MTSPTATGRSTRPALTPRNVRIAVLVCSLVFTSGFVYVGATDLSAGTMENPGAALWPVAVGGLILLLTLVALAGALFRDDDAEPLDLPVGDDRRRALTFFVLMVAFLVTLPIVGFLVGGVLMLTLVMRALGNATWPRCLLTSVPIAVVFYFLFADAFDIKFPVSALESLLGL